MAKTIAELDLHPLAIAVMSYYFEGAGLKESAPAAVVFAELKRVIRLLPTAQVHPAGQDILKVAQALRHIGRFQQAEQLAEALRLAVEWRALHQGQTAVVNERTELAGRAYAALTDQAPALPEAKPEPERPTQPSLAKHGLESMDLATLRRLEKLLDLRR